MTDRLIDETKAEPQGESVVSKLKSCPFCGGKAKILVNNSKHNAYASVYCTKCRAEIRRLISLKYSAVDECVKAWNMRSEKEINKEIEELIENDKEMDNSIFFPGEHFTYNGMEFVCLDVFDNKLLAITAEIIKSMEFSDTCEDDSNDWRQSNIRSWLNEEFIKRFDKNDLILQTSVLTADNGDDSYGVCNDYITLLSCDQYRKYRKFIPTYDDWVWTITPWSCNTGYTSSVRGVNASGALYYDVANHSYGVAVACLFNLDHAKLTKNTSNP
jgi:Lar family restriction alleviation protein